MKKWIKHIGEYKKDTILAPLFMAFEVAMEILIPLVMANMVDQGITGGNMNYLLRTGLILALMCVCSLVFGMLSGRFSARASAGFAKNLRKGMFEKIQGFSFRSIDRFSASSLVTRMTTDVTNVQNAFQMILRVCARAPLMIIFSIISVFTINASLAWVYLAIIPVITIGLALIMTKSTKLFARVFKLYDKLNRIVQENIRGIRVVKSYVREDKETEKFGESSGEIHDNYVKAEKIIAFNSPLMQFCMYACTLLLCWLGAQQIVAGSFTTGQLMSLLTYATQILMSLMMLSMIFVMVTMSKASANRISEVMAEDGEGGRDALTDGTTAAAEGGITEVKDGSIRFRGVSFGYLGTDGEMCLKDIDVEIESGQTVGIIGGTGSGKTSLTQLIPRLYDATEGIVEVGGVDVMDYDLQALRDQVAMVLQKNTLFSGTIKDNLRWGKSDATDEEMEQACIQAQADDFIKSFPDGYDSWVEQGGSNLSGGQKQRLCIARALLKNPKILILDDSTSAVDTKTDALIRKAFSSELGDTTKLIIAQRTSSVQDADKIIVMDNGSISDVGDHNYLMENSKIYKEVYESQKKGGLDYDAA